MKLIPDELKIQTFPCPNCGQIVSSEVDICKFCAVPLSADVKKGAIDKELNEQEKVNLSWNIDIRAFFINFLHRPIKLF